MRKLIFMKGGKGMVNYQNILDFITSSMYIVAPVTIIFVLCESIANLFTSFVRGDRRVKL